MTELSASFRFSWEPATWGQSLKALFYTPPPCEEWFQNLEKFDINAFAATPPDGSPRKSNEILDEKNCNILEKTVAYLAKYSNPRLEGILRSKFEMLSLPFKKGDQEISAADRLTNTFHSILLLSLRSHRPKMLEVCQKILSTKLLLHLYTGEDLIKTAQIEAGDYIQEPQHRVISISKSVIDALQRPFQKIRKIIRYIFSTTRQAYGVDFDTPPNNSSKAQGQWTFYRDSLHDICVIAPIIKTFFTIQLKTSIVIATIFAVSITAIYQLGESPSRSSLQSKPESPANFQESTGDIRGIRSDYVERCHSHSPSSLMPNQEPSAELPRCLKILEDRLVVLNKDLDKNIKDGQQERRKNCNWTTEAKGRLLIKEKRLIKEQIQTQEKHIDEMRKLILRLEMLSHLSSDYEQKEQVAVHFLSKNTTNLEEFKKAYLFFTYLALPVIENEHKSIIDKCKTQIKPVAGVTLHVRSASTSALHPSTSAPAVLTRKGHISASTSKSDTAETPGVQ
jgi:hypothetical protein